MLVCSKYLINIREIDEDEGMIYVSFFVGGGGLWGED